MGCKRTFSNGEFLHLAWCVRSPPPSASSPIPRLSYRPSLSPATATKFSCRRWPTSWTESSPGRRLRRSQAVETWRRRPRRNPILFMNARCVLCVRGRPFGSLCFQMVRIRPASHVFLFLRSGYIPRAEDKDKLARQFCSPGPTVCRYSQASVAAAKSDADRARREFAARRQEEQQNILDRLRQQLSLLQKELAAAKSKAATDISRAQVCE